MNRLLSALGIGMLFLAGCNTHDILYSGYNDIGSEGWPYAEPLKYVVTSADSIADCSMLVNITHDNSYEYSNLWLEVRYTSAHNIEHIDTINVMMCDPLGNWRGKGMPGYYQLNDTLTAGPVSLPDSCTVSLRHIMRVDTLHGISQIGLELVAH